ncbi:MAG: pyridoxal-phosphate-dependent aminotransferase family protein, partial [Desertimonas sp.]
VLMVQTDTASSVRNDVAAIRRAIDDVGHPALLMVDAIASLGCERFEMDDWGVDVTIAASQKGLMTPPGLGLVWAGPRALDARANAGLCTQYWDWNFRSEEGPIYYRFCGTPPVSHLYGLREALRMIADEGLEARWARHRVLADAVRASVEAWSSKGGIDFHARHPEQRGDSVTSIATGSIDAVGLSAMCRDELGVTLGVGLGPLEGRGFRIAHMGHVSPSMVMGVLGVVETALVRMGAPLGDSGLAAAARVLAAGAG